MKNFSVSVNAHYVGSVEIEADTADEAKAIASAGIDNGSIPVDFHFSDCAIAGDAVEIDDEGEEV